MRAEIKDYFLTDSTPFSSAHAYKAEGGGSFLRCGIPKESTESQKGYQVTPKKYPHIYIHTFIHKYIHIDT